MSLLRLTRLSASPQIHVVILCLEARLQSELLYALRAVMRYTT